jgi:hypothetical protein
VRVRIVEGVEPVVLESDTNEEPDQKPSRSERVEDPEFALPGPSGAAIVELLDFDGVEFEATRLFREVFTYWDTTEAGWTPLLATLAEQMDLADSELARRKVEGWFTSLEQSTLLRGYRSSAERFSSVEFLWKNEPSSQTVRGRIDLIWQDAEGAWHIAGLVGEPSDEVRRRWSEALKIQAQVVSREMKASSVVTHLHEMSKPQETSGTSS